MCHQQDWKYASIPRANVSGFFGAHSMQDTEVVGAFRMIFEQPPFSSSLLCYGTTIHAVLS